MILENRARLEKSNYSLKQWRDDVEEEEKGLILALHKYENICSFVERYHTEFNRLKDRALDVGKKNS